MANNECCRCNNFEAYFTRGYCCFLRTNCGKCRKQNMVVDKHHSCEKFKGKYVSPRLKKGIVIGSLETALTNISVIKEFLEEHDEK